MPSRKKPLEPNEGKRDDQERREEFDPTEEKRGQRLDGDDDDSLAAARDQGDTASSRPRQVRPVDSRSK